MSEDLRKKLELAMARAERFKRSRDEAERVLEQKSRELYKANCELAEAQKGLEDDIKQATYELSVSNERLQKALNERSTFIGKMSHEVRTPLNAVLGLSELLLETRMNNSQFDYVDTINSAARSLMVLLSDMLDITKIEAGKLDIQLERVEMARLHKNVVSMFEIEANQKGLELEFNLSKNLPQFVRLDKGRYRQILNNLLSNAIKNTSHGKVKLLVDFKKDSEVKNFGAIVARVEDTGVGIPQDKIDSIFNAYQQLGSEGEGVGLGLAISHQLAELMQGNIRCESELGVGSVFEFTLPTEVINVESLDDRTAAEPYSTDKPSALKILVAEDNPTNQKVLSAQLKSIGQSATFVENGQLALAQLEEQSFDLVLLDILMPIMDGEKTIAAIRASEDKVSKHFCVALTASNIEGQREKLLKKGFDGFLSKPLPMQALMNVLQQADARVPQEQRLAFAEHTDTGEALFDYTFLNSQFGDLSESVFKEIAPTFLKHCTAEIDLLKTALHKGNADKVKKLSHSIKGGAASMGFADFAEQLAKMEEQSDIDNAAELWESTQKSWQRVSQQVRGELTRLEGARHV